MIGFDERTDNNEKNNFRGDRWRSLRRVESSPRGGLHAITITSELHLEHKQNGWKGTGGDVCDRVTGWATGRVASTNGYQQSSIKAW